MDQAIILSTREQEYLLRVIETGVTVRAPHEFFLWTQGQLQALLPHQALVCLQFDGADNLVRLVCLHSLVLAPGALAALEDQADGLALRMARHCRQAGGLPAMVDVGERGPELEQTGPSTITSNANLRNLGGQDDLRAEMAAMRQELTSGLMTIARHTKTAGDALQKFDRDGLPQERA